MRTVLSAAAVAVALALTACGAPAAEESVTPEPAASTSADAAAKDSFPVEVKHALGTTTIESEPVRVATWGWGSTEAAIALGVFPVAVAEQSWTVGEGNLLPWVEAAYDEAGAEKPVVLTDADGGATFPYEEVIAAGPDLILAPYSGLTQEQYDTLTEIAPTVAYPGAPWTTTWQDTISISAQALGRTAAGEDVLADIDGTLAGMKEAHPEFEGKTVAGVWDADGFVYVYTAADPRVGILEEVGLKVAPSVSELDTSDGGFFYELSYEQLDKLDADIVISYHNTEDEAKAFMEKPALQAIPAVKAGRVAQVTDPVTVSSVSPPTALTFDWEGGLPTLIEKIAAVAAK